jgi:hypothetical protein
MVKVGGSQRCFLASKFSKRRRISEGGIHEGESLKHSILTIDPVEHLLNEEEERAGITLTPEQHTAILKILRELVSRDVRSIQELLFSIPGGEKNSIV